MRNLSKQLEDAIFLLEQLKREDHPAVISFHKIVHHLSGVLQSGGRILVCGNGGSFSDACHFAEEFTGRFRADRPAMRAIVLGESAHITCTGNDFGFEHIFSRLVQAYGNSGDALICLTTSGKSPNIINAVKAAKELGISTIGFTGKTGGEIKGSVDYNIHIESALSERIQEVHMFFLHCLVEELEKQLYPELYAP